MQAADLSKKQRCPRDGLFLGPSICSKSVGDQFHPVPDHELGQVVAGQEACGGAVGRVVANRAAVANTTSVAARAKAAVEPGIAVTGCAVANAP